MTERSIVITESTLRRMIADVDRRIESCERKKSAAKGAEKRGRWGMSIQCREAEKILLQEFLDHITE